MKKTLFSVIVPVCNVSPYLRESLNSVLAQTCGDWEAVCVDDGSTDGSGAILDEYAAKDERIKVIHQTNQGVSAARNRALEAANGEWICFLDGDDILEPEMFRRCARLAMAHDLDFVRFDYYLFKGMRKKAELSGKTAVRDATNRLEGKLIETGLFSGAYRRRILDGMRFDPSLKVGEDQVLFGEALKRMRKVGWIDECFYAYRQREGSATHGRRGKEFLMDTIECWRRRLGWLAAEPRRVDRRAVGKLIRNFTEFCGDDYMALPANERGEVWQMYLKVFGELKGMGNLLPWRCRVCVDLIAATGSELMYRVLFIHMPKCILPLAFAAKI